MLTFELHAKQSRAFESVATELLFGGAAGPGKSHFLRISAIRWCLAVPGVQVYFFRRMFPDLEANHMRGPTSFPVLLAELTDHRRVSYTQRDGYVFDNGSGIKLAHCQYESDVEKYQGAEIHVLMIDELTHFTEYMYRFLRSRVRCIGLDVSQKYAALLPRIECASNPGSVGHAWVKRMFRGKPDNEIYRTPPDDGGMLRQYIPARLADNPALLRDDPRYLERLEGLGTPELVRAMRDGDWDIVAGQAFEHLRRDLHSFKPFAIPAHWTRFRAMDWGSSKPFSIGWYAVSDGSDARFPRGALLRYREWYGWNGSPDQGARMESAEVADGIKARETADEQISHGIADPSIFNKHDGPSIAEKMGARGVIWIPGDNNRHLGYLELRGRLKGDDDRPLLFVSTVCDQFWRTTPDLVMDAHDPEDIDTTQEDHCLHGDTPVITSIGIVAIKDLVGKSGEVLSLQGVMEPFNNCRMTMKNAEMVRVLFDDGRFVDCTPNHKFMTELGDWIEAVNLMNCVVHDSISYLINKERDVQSIAEIKCRNPKVISVLPTPPADVYCLEVPTTNAFAVTGGIVVHNCIDEVRYACMSRPWVRKPAATVKKTRRDYVYKEPDAGEHFV